jgi:hypothetical protein
MGLHETPSGYDRKGRSVVGAVPARVGAGTVCGVLMAGQALEARAAAALHAGQAGCSGG